MKSNVEKEECEKRIRLEVDAALNAVYVNTGHREDVQNAAYAYLKMRFGVVSAGPE